ncbi:MAG: carbonic anhydrase [Desulfobacterales bacterium]|nr:carbonic anhydrase [Desulfobacterales bacterium]MBS3754185.1 carbonic anhydrase [Desulfobacterales bacterium]
MRVLSHLFEKNRKWAERIKRSDPDFFARLAKQQAPQYLWIGCSDSRVPANQIVDMPPGEVFVHRNIANLVVHTDVNCMSVIRYAVEVLKIKHIIVCGHYGCGGIKAALAGDGHGEIKDWLENVKRLGRRHRHKIDACRDEDEKHDLLCELNVIEQAVNVSRTPMVLQAWQSGRELAVHGWIYRIEDGILKDLDICITGPEDTGSPTSSRGD